MELASGNDPLEVLRAARSLLEDPTRWSIGARARSADGIPCHPGHKLARAWDIEAAVGVSDNVAGITPLPLLYVLDQATRELFPTKITHRSLKGRIEEPVSDYFTYETANYVNDFLGHEAVLQVLDKAIALVETENESTDSGDG